MLAGQTGAVILSVLVLAEEVFNTGAGNAPGESLYLVFSTKLTQMLVSLGTDTDNYFSCLRRNVPLII